MYNYYNSSTIYVSQKDGNDRVFNGLAPEAGEYGNGPFRTLNKALLSIGQRRVAGFKRPMTVAIVGDYYIDKTIVCNDFNPTVPKSLPLDAFTITSYKGTSKLIGGIKITGWKKDSFNGVSCISASLPERANGERWDFTDLFVNGIRADNTRYPENGYLKAVDTETNFNAISETPLFAPSKWFIAHKEDLEKVEGIEDATVSFYHYWIDEHTAVESYDRDSGKLVLKYPSRFTISTIYSPEEHTSALNYFLENIPTMFKNANEWYLDRNCSKVYYIPENPDIDLNSIEAYAPTVHKLFDFCGSEKETVKDIRFSGIELMCTRSDYVSRYVKNPVSGNYEYIENFDDGYASDIQSACYANGAISFRFAERCSVENCIIRHVGTYGVEVREGCRNVRIENNHFEDMGAGGVRIFGGTADEDSRFATEGCIVRGNKILGCGKRLAAGCGVLICHASNNEISENEIAYLDYTGISVGWVWGYLPSATYGNIIKGNHIHHIGQGRLSDMGGIYLLGKQQGTIVSGNRIHDVSSAHYGGWGIYTDEGSSYITIENNVVYNTKCESFHQHYGSYNIIRNNIFALGSACVRVSQNEMHDCAAFENNIYVVDKDTPCYSSVGLSQVISRNNFIYNLSGGEPLMYRSHNGEIEAIGFEKWTKDAAKDTGTVILNPEFADLEAFDFTLDEDSPAAKLGFIPIKGFTASGKK